jgi:ubiquinone biosynthesis UbiH/UbiF/VisC/COQ6 family hydroxylase
MNEPIKADVIIVGAGLVGASLALALKDARVSVLLIEAKPPASIPTDESWDNRVYAINPGSEHFLRELGVWQMLDATRCAPIEAMQVWGDDGEAEIDFTAQDANQSSLGHIVENRQLQNVLWQTLQQQSHVRLMSPTQCESLELSNITTRLKLADGTDIHASLIVGADGADSWVREQSGITSAGKSYNQSGVVANFAVEKHHGNIARQWFDGSSVLACLPLPGNLMSMVWSLSSQQAHELMQMSHAALCEKVAEAGHHSLGKLELITPPASFPLRLLQVKQQVKPNIALIGDAAHALHPLAGQGVNLGFQDVRVLTQVLASRAGHENCGDYHLLRRFERARKEDILAMQWTTDGLQQLFSLENSLAKTIRNKGLALTNRQGWLKRQLIRHAVR